MPRRARLALSGACIGVLLLVAIWYAAHYIGFVRHADASILSGFVGLGHPHPGFGQSHVGFGRSRLNTLTNLITGLCGPQRFVVLAALPVLVAFLRGRPRTAVMLCVILLCANETTELLKPLLAGPRDFVRVAPLSDASWPSGTATAAMTLCLCWVIAAPARWRPAVAAAMATFAVAVSYSLLELGWHYPSDVLGGFLVATTWTLLAIASLTLYEQRRPAEVAEAPGRFSLAQALGPPAVVAAGALLAAALIVVARPHEVIDYAQQHTWFVIGATLIAALGLSLASGVMLMLRSSGAVRRPVGAPLPDPPRLPASQE
jgi:membrane-associated phospholipid phosphatase